MAEKYEPNRLWPFVYDHDDQHWHVDWWDVSKVFINVALLAAGIFILGFLFYTGLVVVD
jgi:hypothetical protein